MACSYHKGWGRGSLRVVERWATVGGRGWNPLESIPYGPRNYLSVVPRGDMFRIDADYRPLHYQRIA